MQKKISSVNFCKSCEIPVPTIEMILNLVCFISVQNYQKLKSSLTLYEFNYPRNCHCLPTHPI